MTNRPKVERCIDKALQLGAQAALCDLPRKGRPGKISAEARAWVVSLACVKPKQLGYPEELWTTRLLARQVREHCEQAGHACLPQLARGTVSKILSRAQLRSHKIEYYLEKRDPEFEQKMAQVLVMYKLVELAHKRVQARARSGQAPQEPLTVFVSYDEKPGIQAIGWVAADLAPQPGQHAATRREYEYKRNGALDITDYRFDREAGKSVASLRFYDGVLGTLDDLANRSTSMGVVTNLPGQLVKTVLQNTGIAGHFKTVVTPRFGVPANPKPHGIRRAPEEMGREADVRTWMQAGDEAKRERWRARSTARGSRSICSRRSASRTWSMCRSFGT